MLHSWRVFRSTRLKEHGNGHKPASPVHQRILLRLGFVLSAFQANAWDMVWEITKLWSQHPPIYTPLPTSTWLYMRQRQHATAFTVLTRGLVVLPFPKVCSFPRPKLAGLRLAAWQSSAVLHGSLWGALRKIFLHPMHGDHSCFISDHYLQHAAVPGMSAE